MSQSIVGGLRLRARKPASRKLSSVAGLAGLACLAVSLTACDLAALGHLAGRATDEWSRSYQLTPGGTIWIGNTNGRIEIEAADTQTVEVKAERIARATTDEAAREILPKIVIREDVRPDRIELQTERVSGFTMGISFEVRYHVRAPKSAVVDVNNTNGAVLVTGMAGNVAAKTTNGSVTLRDLTGEVQGRTTNGSLNVDMASVASHSIALRTTNGSVTLRLPESTKADITATWTNGGISVGDVKMDVSERSRRRFEGRMNGGGAPIELHTTNGGIRIRGRASAESDTDESRPDGERR